ncbi:hypothetical protein [Streptomyces rubellomurinus]|uniref:Transferase n=1 Tax=Streptomyces rubellomurinus (strain ATCC 31215) TaxID=359131 RepID=A0A0F2T894_STRR3|nr:hypothetical protein [Streptomyces rubellomurinus]KJS59444.1 hypothetical protein VM95_27090 [Streptomyces rubellomurinus]
MIESEFWQRLDGVRRARGLLTPGELMALTGRGVVVLDPFSVLVSTWVRLGPETVLYPGAAVECDARSRCVLQPGTVLYGGARITATGGALVTIGRGALIGEGGARIKAAGTDRMRLGDAVRIANGAELSGSCRLGDGSQVLGPISARAVELAGGGSHAHPDPDGRGGVLKGFGRAHGIRVGVGEVVNGAGDFRAAPVERQRAYHPAAPKLD